MRVCNLKKILPMYFRDMLRKRKCGQKSKNVSPHDFEKYVSLEIFEAKYLLTCYGGTGICLEQ